MRGRKNSLDILFNVLHPDFDEEEILDQSQETDEDDEGGDDEEKNALDFENKAFVVATRRLMNQPNWLSLRKIFSEPQNKLWLGVLKGMNIPIDSDKASLISSGSTRSSRSVQFTSRLSLSRVRWIIGP